MKEISEIQTLPREIITRSKVRSDFGRAASIHQGHFEVWTRKQVFSAFFSSIDRPTCGGQDQPFCLRWWGWPLAGHPDTCHCRQWHISIIGITAVNIMEAIQNSLLLRQQPLRWACGTFGTTDGSWRPKRPGHPKRSSPKLARDERAFLSTGKPRLPSITLRRRGSGSRSSMVFTTSRTSCLSILEPRTSSWLPEGRWSRFGTCTLSIRKIPRFVPDQSDQILRNFLELLSQKKAEFQHYFGQKISLWQHCNQAIFSLVQFYCKTWQFCANFAYQKKRKIGYE